MVETTVRNSEKQNDHYGHANMLACFVFEIHLHFVAFFFFVKTRHFKKCARKLYLLHTTTQLTLSYARFL